MKFQFSSSRADLCGSSLALPARLSLLQAGRVRAVFGLRSLEFPWGLKPVPRPISLVTSCRARVGRVTPCAPRSADSFPNGAHGVTRPTTSRNLFVTELGAPRFTEAHGHGIANAQAELSSRVAAIDGDLQYPAGARYRHGPPGRDGLVKRRHGKQPIATKQDRDRALSQSSQGTSGNVRYRVSESIDVNHLTFNPTFALSRLRPFQALEIQQRRAQTFNGHTSAQMCSNGRKNVSSVERAAYVS